VVELVVVVSSLWKQKVSNGHRSSDRTHVEVLKDLFEAQPPGGDRLSIFLHVEMSRDYIPFTPID